MDRHYNHTPVLLSEMLSILSPEDGAIYIDATFGAGGYSHAILKSADCQVYGIDKDEEVKKFYNELNSSYPGKINLTIDKFSNLKSIVEKNDIKKVSGIIFDIGVSSMQLEDGHRGFSFMRDGPLDMRMGKSLNHIDASTFVNSIREEEIANIIYQYGGERYSRRIAKAIIEARKKELIKTTGELASIVRSVVPRGKQKIDPATRTFQAIRIWVNDELNELKKGIKSAAEVLMSGGKIIVISFHSLEDRIVKNFFNELNGKNMSHGYFQDPSPTKKEFEIINKKVIKPTDKEITNNPRARSAKLRSVLKL